jgi:UDP-glucose 4-epimerase
VRDRAGLRDRLAGVEAICHLAAISGVQECDATPEAAFDVNVGGTENVAWLCREWATPLVFPCSMAIIGDPVSFPITAEHPRGPLNLYGRMKTMSEDDIHQLADDAFPAHVLMKTNLYGAHEIDGQSVDKHTVINIFVERALERKPLQVHEPGTQARDFIHVKDVGQAYRRSIETLLEADPGAVTFPLGSGESASILDIAETVQAIVEDERGFRVPIELVDNPRSDETEVGDFDVHTDRAREVIGFEATRSIESAVRSMVRAG